MPCIAASTAAGCPCRSILRALCPHNPRRPSTWQHAARCPRTWCCPTPHPIACALAWMPAGGRTRAWRACAARMCTQAALAAVAGGLRGQEGLEPGPSAARGQQAVRVGVARMGRGAWRWRRWSAGGALVSAALCVAVAGACRHALAPTPIPGCVAHLAHQPQQACTLPCCVAAAALPSLPCPNAPPTRWQGGRGR